MTASNSTVEELLVEADKLHCADHLRQAYDILEAAVNQQHVDDPRVLWRLGRACYRLGQEETDADRCKQLMVRGNDLLQSAVQRNAEDPGANKWAGILLGKMGDYISTKEKISNAHKIRDYFVKATQLDPNDATAYHCLGVWHWNVMQIGFVERGIASVVFGKPPTSTYDECETCLLASDRLDPTQIHNSLLIGDVYAQQRRWSDAKKFYAKAAECTVNTKEQKRQHDEALRKLSKC